MSICAIFGGVFSTYGGQVRYDGAPWTKALSAHVHAEGAFGSPQCWRAVILQPRAAGTAPDAAEGARHARWLPANPLSCDTSSRWRHRWASRVDWSSLPCAILARAPQHSIAGRSAVALAHRFLPCMNSIRSISASTTLHRIDWRTAADERSGKPIKSIDLRCVRLRHIGFVHDLLPKSCPSDEWVEA